MASIGGARILYVDASPDSQAAQGLLRDIGIEYAAIDVSERPEQFLGRVPALVSSGDRFEGLTEIRRFAEFVKQYHQRGLLIR